MTMPGFIRNQDPRLMAVTIISRAGWGAKPAESVTPWNPANLLGICQHWFGSPKAAAPTPAVTTSSAPSSAPIRRASSTTSPTTSASARTAACMSSAAGTGRRGRTAPTRRTRRCWRSCTWPAQATRLTDKGKASLIALYNEAFRRGVPSKRWATGALRRQGRTVLGRSSATSWRRGCGGRPARPRRSSSC